MEKSIIVQKWVKHVDDAVEMGIKYYTLLSIVNELGLTPRECEMLSFTSVQGTISSLQAKKDFCKRFNSTLATVGNLMTRLSSLDYLVREGKKLVVNKNINFDFEKNFIISIKLNGQEERDNTDVSG